MNKQFILLFFAIFFIASSFCSEQQKKLSRSKFFLSDEYMKDAIKNGRKEKGGHRSSPLPDNLIEVIDENNEIWVVSKNNPDIYE